MGETTLPPPRLRVLASYARYSSPVTTLGQICPRVSYIGYSLLAAAGVVFAFKHASENAEAYRLALSRSGATRRR